MDTPNALIIVQARNARIATVVLSDSITCLQTQLGYLMQLVTYSHTLFLFEVVDDLLGDGGLGSVGKDR